MTAALPALLALGLIAGAALVRLSVLAWTASVPVLLEAAREWSERGTLDAALTLQALGAAAALLAYAGLWAMALGLVS